MTKPTREQILNEPAGRQIDAWMHLRVMIDVEYYPGGELPYSTDLALVGPILARLTELECLFKITYGMNWEDVYRVVMATPKNTSGEAVDKSLPLALCRAALLAVTL